METELETASSQDRVLTNVCAEFVENRAGQQIIRRATDIEEQELEANAPTFVAEQDQFRPQDEVPKIQDQYQRSSERMTEFQDILRRFSKLLKDRKIFKKLNLEIKEPEPFDINYVLQVATAVREHRENSERTNTCKRFIRSCLGGVEKHRTVIRGILECVPNDIYGAIIGRGFAMILASVEHNEKLRTDIQSALAEIPEKLERVKDLSDAYRNQSTRLHECADGVLVAIFDVLERVVDRLTLTLKENPLAKIKSAGGGDVKGSLSKLEDSITAFDRAVHGCAYKSISHIENTTMFVKEDTSMLRMQMGEMRSVLEDVKSYQVLALEQSEKKLLESPKTPENRETLGLPGSETDRLQHSKSGEDNDRRVVAIAYNVMYRFLQSNPMYNPRSPDKLIQSETGYFLGSQVSQWRKLTKSLDANPNKEMETLVNRAESLSLTDKDKVQFIMTSKAFQGWLGRTESHVLEIKCESTPQDLINSVSVSTAILGSVVGSETNACVLGFFCGLRKNISLKEEHSGLVGILKTFNSQLLRFLTDQGSAQAASLSSLGQPQSWKISAKSTTKSLELFDLLLSALPDNTQVFILLESISKIAGDKTDGDELMKHVVDLIEQSPQLIIKVLVTNCLPSSGIRNIALCRFNRLTVPDNIDGGRNGANFRSLGRRSLSPVVGMEKRPRSVARNISDQDAEEDSSDEDDHEEEDDSD